VISGFGFFENRLNSLKTRRTLRKLNTADPVLVIQEFTEYYALSGFKKFERKKLFSATARLGILILFRYKTACKYIYKIDVRQP